MTTARRTFVSLRNRNYRLFFDGQLTSQIGSWMQRIALAWYVLELTKSPQYPHGSPFAVGVMAFAQFLPFTLFGLFAGVITDRLDARRLVLGTQIGQTIVGDRPHVDRVRRHRAAVDALLDRVRQRRDHGARRAVAPAADVPDGRARDAAERDRAQLEPLQRVADPRPVGGGRPPRLRRRRRLFPRQRDQLRRRARRAADDADERVLPRSRSSSGRASSPARRRGSRTCGRSRGCSPCSR